MRSNSKLFKSAGTRCGVTTMVAIAATVLSSLHVAVEASPSLNERHWQVKFQEPNQSQAYRRTWLANKDDGASLPQPNGSFTGKWRNRMGRGDGDSQPPDRPFAGQRMRIERSGGPTDGGSLGMKRPLRDRLNSTPGPGAGRAQDGASPSDRLRGANRPDRPDSPDRPERPERRGPPEGIGGGLFGRKALDLSHLNLSDDQKQRIQQIHSQNGQKGKDLRKSLMTAREEFKDMMFDPAASDDQIRAKRHQLKQMQDKMEEIQLSDYLSIRQILSPDQRQMLSDQRSRGPKFAEGGPAQGRSQGRDGSQNQPQDNGAAVPTNGQDNK